MHRLTVPPLPPKKEIKNKIWELDEKHPLGLSSKRRKTILGLFFVLFRLNASLRPVSSIPSVSGCVLSGGREVWGKILPPLSNIVLSAVAHRHMLPMILWALI